MRMIGITPRLSDQTTGLITVTQTYLDAIHEAGALPVLLPLINDQELYEEMLSRIDGLLLSGGTDIEPSLYGEEKLPACGNNLPLRDQEEFYLCRRAVEMDLPVLAICRGIQVLNCALGGTLYQDIPTQYSRQVNHLRPDALTEQIHSVTLEKDSKLDQIIGKTQVQVNSCHHQGIKTPGAGLRVTARAEDGLTEGVELPEKRFVVGVQWHPEAIIHSNPEAQAIFKAFVQACGEKS